MPDHHLLGTWIRRFLLEHLVTERNQISTEILGMTASALPFPTSFIGDHDFELKSCMVNLSSCTTNSSKT
jgi:hypothetical protein